MKVKIETFHVVFSGKPDNLLEELNKLTKEANKFLAETNGKFISSEPSVFTCYYTALILTLTYEVDAVLPPATGGSYEGPNFGLNLD